MELGPRQTRPQDAIADHVKCAGVTLDVARILYGDCLVWARALDTDRRKAWYSGASLTAFRSLQRGLEEGMRNHGEL